jgi:hypothetical protein
MSDLDTLIASWQRKLEEHERAAAKIKMTINQALDLEGRPPLYAEADLAPSTPQAFSFKQDAFFGKPLASCVRQILEQRGSATNQDELYDQLVKGGFDFEAKSVDLSKRNLAISLGKNMLFQRTPNGLWGLRDWYPNSKGKKKNGSPDTTTEDTGSTALKEVDDLLNTTT